MALLLVAFIGTVYSSEGASTVVPDRVTEIVMAAYEQLQAPQDKLQFFKLLATDFGVQRKFSCVVGA